MKRGVAAAVVLAVMAVPAVAAQDTTITAYSYRFTPRTLTIAPGETVTFAISSGVHNFRFEDGPAYPPVPSPPDDPAWDEPPRRTFDELGTYRFYCEAHPTLMDGVITVGEESPEPTPDPSPDPGDPLPGDPPPGGGDPGSPPPPPGGGGGGTEVPVAVETLAVTRRVFCARRGPGCRRPGVRLRIELSRAAAVTGTLRRRPLEGRRRARRFGRVDLGVVGAGPRTVRFARAGGRRLRPGRYVLVLRVGDDVTETLRFRVRR